MSPQTTAHRFFESRGLLRAVEDPREVKKYKEDVVQNDLRWLWTKLRSEMPMRVWFAEKWWQLCTLFALIGILIWNQSYVIGNSILVLDLLFLLWTARFNWKNSVPDWEDSMFADFQQESPGLYQELTNEVMRYTDGRGNALLELYVEWHPSDPRRYLVLKDCLGGRKYHFHHWEVPQIRSVVTTQVEYAPQ